MKAQVLKDRLTTVRINTLEEYEFVRKGNVHPLIDWRHFDIEHNLRVFLQNQLFGYNFLGHGDVLKANNKFYHYCWDHHLIFEGRPIHVCEECQKPLNNYSAAFISHILTKGGHSEMSHDPRNFNLLCFKCHNRWEFGTLEQKRKMKIFEINEALIEILIEEYNVNRKNFEINSQEARIYTKTCG